jgi:hypothetical protein
MVRTPCTSFRKAYLWVMAWDAHARSAHGRYRHHGGRFCHDFLALARDFVKRGARIG